MKSLLLFFLIYSAQSSTQTTLESQPKSGSVVFETYGPSQLITIKGSGNELKTSLKVEDKKISGKIVFALQSLSTGLLARDEIMKNKYLQVQLFPEATLTFSDFTMTAGWTFKTPKVARSSFRAKLSLHGVEKEITGLYSIESDLKVTADFEVKLSDYKIETPEYNGVKVADFVKIRVSLDRLTQVK